MKYNDSPNKNGVEELWHVLREAIGMRRLAVSIYFFLYPETHSHRCNFLFFTQAQGMRR